MNYYEELGIRPDADTEEIRKAHRRLVKLMHPDQHRDQGLKQLAETQMRRLNSIVATLLDPEEREEYDEQLKGEAIGHAPRQSTWRSVPWWIASTFGAIVLTVGAVWFWADRMGSSISTHTPIVIENPDTPAPSKETTTTVPVPMPSSTERAPTAQPEPANPTVTVPPAPTPVREKPAEAAEGFPTAPAKKVAMPAPTLPPASTPSVRPKSAEPLNAPKRDAARGTPQAAKTVPAETPKIDGKRKLGPVPLVSQVTVPKQQWQPDGAPTLGNSAVPAEDDWVVIDHGRIPAPKALRNDPLEGEWVYAPTEPEKGKPGFYPPEFIKLKLVKQADGMHGEYNARYNVVDSRPVSPEVSFALKSVDKDSRKYVWTAADGRHGTFELRLLESDIMRLEWRTTGGRSGPALTSGMATLVRKN
jgi:hypothetical protein